MGVLADGLEQPVARPPPRGLAGHDHRLVHEPREHVEREPGRDCHRGVGVETAHEHGEVPERPLLRWIKQVVAPLHRRPNRLVASGGEPRPAAEGAKARLEVGEDLRRRHDSDPRGGELDRERQTVEPLAQRRDRRVPAAIRDELRLPLPRPLDEQTLRVLRLERVQPPDGLAAYAQRFAARRQDPQAVARAQQRRCQLRAGVDHVLAVVEHQQHVAGGQVVAQRLGRGGPGAAADVERAGDLGRRVRVRTTRREIHEPDPVSASSDLTAGELHGEPGLADAARTSQRHKPRPAEGLTDALKLARPADQRRQRYGHIVHSGTPKPGSSRAGRRHHRIDHHTLTRRDAMLAPAASWCWRGPGRSAAR